jgi:hypothetical protein
MALSYHCKDWHGSLNLALALMLGSVPLVFAILLGAPLKIMIKKSGKTEI